MQMLKNARCTGDIKLETPPAPNESYFIHSSQLCQSHARLFKHVQLGGEMETGKQSKREVSREYCSILEDDGI